MADNFRQTVQTIEQDINPNGAPGSITALNHQNILKDILNKAGKYVGLPYSAQKNITGTYSNGQFSFNNNALNGTGSLVFSFAFNSADGLNIETSLNSLQPDNLLMFKDFAGRSAQFMFQSFTTNNTKNSYDVTVTAIAGNPNYTYQDNEMEIGVFSFLPMSTTQANDIITLAGTRFRRCKKPSNTGTGLEQGDFVVNGRLNDALINFAKYNTGDINDFGTLANRFEDGSYTDVSFYPSN